MENNNKNSIMSNVFATLQKIGKALFLPIAILPFAGLLLGIGSSFTNEMMLKTYNLTNILHPGTILYSIMLYFKNAGSIIFDNLPLIFALAIGLGMAEKEKGIATLSAGIFYIVMLVTINSCLVDSGLIVNGVVDSSVKRGAIANVVGIQTLQLGVFGGIIAGMIAAILCNKFYKMQLPDVLAFFSGIRFVPIICMFVAIITGIILFHTWPHIQSAIYALGGLVKGSGYIGTFIYGCIQRALIPFGLHHIFYMPFWQTGVGGSAMIDGALIEGAQNIFFAELASKNTVKFSVEACRFLTGPYAFMMGGLPGAAFAMYTTAKPENKKKVGSLLISTALTAFLTGITEPIEFTFLFVAPILYIIHVLFAGLAHMISHIMSICIGTTFSDGLIDFVLYGVLPGNAKTNWMIMVPIIILYFIIYYIVFAFIIKKLDLKTPGRGNDDDEIKLVTKAEYQEKMGISNANTSKNVDDPISQLILLGLGGKQNIENLDCCATRLRVTVKNENEVSKDVFKSTGAAGVIASGKGVQIIYGPKVSIIKSNLEEYMQNVDDDVRVEKSVKEEYITHNDIIVTINSEIDDEKVSNEVTVSSDKAVLKYTIKDSNGMHARPAANIVKFFSTFKNKINIKANDKEVIADSMLNIMSLGLKHNDTIDIIVNGSDNENVIKKIKEYLENNGI